MEEEVEEFKYLGMWVDRKLRGIIQLEKMAKKGRRVDWKSEIKKQDCTHADHSKLDYPLLFQVM